MSQSYHGKICPYCKFPIKRNSEVVLCSICKMPHHKECWQENRGCTTFGHQGHSKGVMADDSGLRKPIDIDFKKPQADKVNISLSKTTIKIAVFLLVCGLVFIAINSHIQAPEEALIIEEENNDERDNNNQITVAQDQSENGSDTDEEDENESEEEKVKTDDRNVQSHNTISWDGGTYTGEIVNGKPHGQGKLIYPSGAEYVGEFYSGLFHGQGVYISEDGVRHEGGFKQGKPHGYGITYHPDGRRFQAEWKDGEVVRGKEYD